MLAPAQKRNCLGLERLSIYVGLNLIIVKLNWNFSRVANPIEKYELFCYIDIDIILYHEDFYAG